ncbi:MAG: isochorismatase family cysteine hydrolase [bacterium]
MTALILIDIEREWINEKSDYFIGSDLQNYIKNINSILDFSRESGYKIIFIRHIEKDSASSFIENDDSTEILSGINLKKSDIVIDKYNISSFYKTELEKELIDVKNVLVTGILTNLCVRMFVEEAYDRKFGITIVEDCCTTFSEKIHSYTIKDLQITRPEINVTTLDNLIN